MGTVTLDVRKTTLQEFGVYMKNRKIHLVLWCVFCSETIRAHYGFSKV